MLRLMFLLNFCFVFLAGNPLMGQPPANDECSGAILFSTVPFGSSCTSLVNGSTAGATKSSPNPSCTSVENDDDVWYQFVASSQSVIIRFGNITNNSTMGSAIAGFALYASPCPSSTTTITCVNLGSAGAGYWIIDGLTIGSTYFLRLWSTLTGTNSMTFQFCVQDVPPPPANDECSNASLITTQPAGSTCNTGIHSTTVGSTRSMPDASCGSGFTNDDVWYRFVANANGVRLNFSNATRPTTPSSPATVGYALYDASCPSTTSSFSCDNNIGTTNGSVLIGGLTPGATYYLRLFSYDINNYMTLDFCLVDVNLPANDLCSNAQMVTVGNGFCTSPLLTTLTDATSSPGFTAPACANLSGSEDVWYKVTIPSSGNLVIQSSAADSKINDLVMEAYSGTCSTLSLISCNDDGNPDVAPSGNHPRISLTGRTPGEIVYIRMLGKGTINFGPFSLCAWDSTVTIPISSGGNCLSANTVTFSASNGNLFQWVPVFDAAGHIVAEVRANGNELGDLHTDVHVNTSGVVRNVAGQYYLDRNIAFQSAVAASASVRFYFRNSEFAALQAADPSITGLASLDVTKTNTGCQSSLTGTSTLIQVDTFGSYGADHFLQYTTSSFSSFYINRQDAVLPLKFLSFHAYSTGSGNRLNWVVAKDPGLHAFEIQQSIDGLIFETITTQLRDAFINQTAGAWEYSYYHPSGGYRFYRIKLLGNNGEMLYSNIIRAGASKKNDDVVNVYPNPVSDVLQVRLLDPGASVEISLFDLNGRILKRCSGKTTSLYVEDLAEGVYLHACTNKISRHTQYLHILKTGRR